LPDVDGTEIIRQVRADESPIPIIVLSSRSDEAAKVNALDLGADDYVTKPFGIDELLARIRAALRHKLQQEGETPVFRSGDLTVDLVRRIVTARGVEVKFSPREYALLRLLVQHAGKVLTHRFILQQIWVPNADIQYLRIYIRALRRKIDTCASALGSRRSGMAGFQHRFPQIKGTDLHREIPRHKAPMISSLHALGNAIVAFCCRHCPPCNLCP
jgi:DNA-binding response OmpR family regulator